MTKVVYLLNPTLPNGDFLNQEECCFGPTPIACTPTSLVGLASALLETDYSPIHATAVKQLTHDAYAVVLPFVIGYEQWLNEMVKEIHSHCPKAKVIGIAVPQGLAEVSEYRSSFDLLAGREPLPTVLKYLGLESEYFPVIRVGANVPYPFMPWLLVATGCPFGCNYCTWGSRPMQWRSPENTMESINSLLEGTVTLSETGVPEVGKLSQMYLICSEATVNKRWLKDFTSLKESSLYQLLPILTDVRADQVDEETIDLFKRMKVREVVAALESPNPDILKKIDRRMNIEKWLKGMQLLKEANIKISMPVLFNLDDSENPNEYASFCKDHHLTPNPGIVKAYPGTKLWEEVERDGWEWIREWSPPASPLRTRKGVFEAGKKLNRFKELMR